MKKRILFLVNDAGFFFSHRVNLALAAVRCGYTVAVACPADELTARLHTMDIQWLETSRVRDRNGPIGLLGIFVEYFRVLRRWRPSMVHLITSKPVILGGLAARVLRIPVIAAISGLGYIFTGSGMKFRIMRRLAAFGYRLALGHRDAYVIFQNATDRDIFFGLGICSHENSFLFRGSGVDLQRIRPHKEPEGAIVALLPARILRDKGVYEFVAAARIVRGMGSSIVFRLQGIIDASNPTAVRHEEIDGWIEEGVVEYLPYSGDVDTMLASAHIIVLPSYREGLPKTLIDAAAAGRAVVTADVPGCRDAILPGESGLLVPVRDAAALAEAIVQLSRDAGRRRAYGAAGRRLAETHFDLERITEQHLDIYRMISGDEA